MTEAEQRDCFSTALLALRCALWHTHRPFRLMLVCKSVREVLLSEYNESTARQAFEREFPSHVRSARLYDPEESWRELYRGYCNAVACAARVHRLHQVYQQLLHY
ncbi:Hypothetical protein UVM_LOCUS171 [uncultured virus]|nr:Hypothetical protein UVM_LOCUS171 [uncultured virus]